MIHLSPAQQRVVEYMQKNGSITTLESNMYLGDTRLSARIFELKEKGFKIANPKITVQNRFGEETNVCRYSIIKYPDNF